MLHGERTLAGAVIVGVGINVKSSVSFVPSLSSFRHPIPTTSSIRVEIFTILIDVNSKS